MRPEAVPWWRQAEADLEAARQNHDLGISFAVSWFAQQAAEKSLKALYIEQRGVMAPRTHDLRYLAAEVSVPAALQAEIQRLNQTFDLVRYPDYTSGRAPVDEISASRAAGHLADAERVVIWIGQQIT